MWQKKSYPWVLLPFPALFGVHYSLAVEYKPLGKDPVWLEASEENSGKWAGSCRVGQLGRLETERVSNCALYDKKKNYRILCIYGEFGGRFTMEVRVVGMNGNFISSVMRGKNSLCEWWNRGLERFLVSFLEVPKTQLGKTLRDLN